MLIGLLLEIHCVFLGMSAYNGLSPSFPSQRFLEMYPDDLSAPAISVIWETFGKDMRLIKDFVLRFEDRPHAIEVHASNECARRHPSRNGHQIGLGYNSRTYSKLLTIRDPKLLREVKQRMSRIITALLPVINEYSQIYISTGLEGTFSDDAHTAIYRAFRSVMEKRGVSGWHIVRSGIEPLPPAPGKIMELHGDWAKARYPHSPKIINFDGISVDVGDGENFFQHISLQEAEDILIKDRWNTIMAFYWSASVQGLREAKDWNHGIGYHRRKTLITKEAIKHYKASLSRLDRIVNVKLGCAQSHEGGGQ